MDPAGAPITEAAPLARMARHCPVCGTPSAEGRPLGIARPPWSLVACRSCGFAHLSEAPPYEALAEDLAWEQTHAAERVRRARANPVITAVDQATRFRLALRRRKPRDVIAAHARPGPVIEIGCGGGEQLTPPPPGFTPFGIDISVALSARARAAFRAHGGDCLTASALDGLRQLPSGHFTAALLHAYLEHEADPAAVLAGLARVLTPDAVVVVKVPNYGSWNRRLMGAKWCGYRFPDHLNYFTPASLAALARKAGFSTAFPPGWALPTSDNMWALLHPEPSRAG